MRALIKEPRGSVDDTALPEPAETHVKQPDSDLPPSECKSQLREEHCREE